MPMALVSAKPFFLAQLRCDAKLITVSLDKLPLHIHIATWP